MAYLHSHRRSLTDRCAIITPSGRHGVPPLPSHAPSALDRKAREDVVVRWHLLRRAEEAGTPSTKLRSRHVSTARFFFLTILRTYTTVLRRIWLFRTAVVVSPGRVYNSVVGHCQDCRSKTIQTTRASEHDAADSGCCGTPVDSASLCVRNSTLEGHRQS